MERVTVIDYGLANIRSIVNALELAQQLEKILPSGARLHVVSHSRGGLVGELLCRSMVKDRKPFDDLDEELFSTEERKGDLEALKQLGRSLQKNNFHIERFIRVGCPAAGTTLASGRLDRYVSVMLNLLEHVPGFAHNPVFEIITDQNGRLAFAFGGITLLEDFICYLFDVIVGCGETRPAHVNQPIQS